MRRMNILLGSTLASTAVLLGGCAMPSTGTPSTQKQYTTDNSIFECGLLGTPDGSNVEPTYLPNQPGYSRQTDPNVLRTFQAAHPEQYSRGDVIGLETIVCDAKVGKPHWSGGKASLQVLTQDAIRMALDPQLQ